MQTIKYLLQNRRLSTIIVGLLGAVKIITSALGWNFITNQEVNDIANGVAALLTLITVVMSHEKPAKNQAAGPPSTSANPTQGKQTNGAHTNDPSGTGTSGAATHIDPPDPSAASDGYARPQ